MNNKLFEMRNLSFKAVLVLLMSTAFVACNKSGLKKPDLSKTSDKVSYSIGYNIGNSLRSQGISDIDPSIIARGIQDALNGDSLMSKHEMSQTMNDFQNNLYNKRVKQQTDLANQNLKKSQEFLAKNKQNDSVKVTKSGLQYKILKKGTGPRPGLKDSVVVNYVGKLINGKTFDSSYSHGGPVTLAVNHVIQGWTEAIQMMHVGGKWRIYLPPDLAYGKRGAGSAIGPEEALIFDVQLLKIKKK